MTTANGLLELLAAAFLATALGSTAVLLRRRGWRSSDARRPGLDPLSALPAPSPPPNLHGPIVSGLGLLPAGFA